MTDTGTATTSQGTCGNCKYLEFYADTHGMLCYYCDHPANERMDDLMSLRHSCGHWEDIDQRKDDDPQYAL